LTSDGDGLLPLPSSPHALPDGRQTPRPDVNGQVVPSLPGLGLAGAPGIDLTQASHPLTERIWRSISAH